MEESISGVRVEPHTRTIAIVGNPNTGKSTLFNRLTGLRQKVANYPGVTVERHYGKSTIEGLDCTWIDLPGTYSLSAQSPDERVVIDALEGKLKDDRPDLVLFVLDPLQLRRHLFLLFQLAELRIPSVVCFNFWDQVQRRKVPLSLELLEAKLGVPCIPVAASSGSGMDRLAEAIANAFVEPRHLRQISWSRPIEEALAKVASALKEEGLSFSRADSLRILFDVHPAVADRIGWRSERDERVLKSIRNELQQKAIHPLAAEAVIINKEVDRILAEVLPDESCLRDPTSRSLDRIFTHPFFGSLLFFSILFLVFQSVYSWAGPLMDAVEHLKGWTQDLVSPWFAATPIIQSMVSDGIIEGVGSVLVFLPQILILFLFVALLEDSGYMARAAFLMDKLFSWCGLNGKSFVPLISSYACAIPGIMAARTIEDPKTRLTTIFIAPFMSCSARLPVYVLLIGAFVEPVYGAFWAGLALFGMHLVGLLVALPVAWFMNTVLLKAKSQPFLLELPSYRLPQPVDVCLRIVTQARRFIVEAGTIIFSITIVIWAMLYFPRPESLALEVRQDFAREKVAHGLMTAEEGARLVNNPAALPDWNKVLQRRIDSEYVEQSLMGRLGKSIQPVFAPAGFDWKITVGVVASFPAREVIISTLGVIYSLGGDVDEESGNLRGAMAAQIYPEDSPRAGQAVYSLPVVFSILVFFALCQQCGATVAIISRELNNRWAIGSFVFMTTLAWLCAVGVFQVASLLGGG